MFKEKVYALRTKTGLKSSPPGYGYNTKFVFGMHACMQTNLILFLHVFPMPMVGPSSLYCFCCMVFPKFLNFLTFLLLL